VEARVAAAFGTWGAAARSGTTCTDFTFQNDGLLPTSHRAVGQDSVNAVLFRNGVCAAGENPNVTNCWKHGPGTIGMTTTSFDSRTGQIFDADMELFAWNGFVGHYFTCGSAADPDCAFTGQTGCNDVDLQAVATHEAGHMLGLAHPCTLNRFLEPGYPECAPTEARVMGPAVGTIALRTLTGDDVEGICTVYPKAAATLTCAPAKGPESSGGCASAGPTGIAGLLLAAIAAARLRRRRR
jgi:uncharacterized protein (TIGR03382 family)